MSGVVVEVSARKVSIPFECPCCGYERPDGEFSATHTRTTGKRVVRSTTREFSFPCCSRCMAHVKMWESAAAITPGFVAVGIIVAVVVGIAAAAVAGIAVFGTALVLGRVLESNRRQQAKATCGPSCATPSTSVSYLGWSGSVSSFRFASPTYAGRFANQNARSLVNVNLGLRRVLETSALVAPPVEASVIAQRSGQAPAVPRTAAVAGSNDSVLEWIARIEGYKGPIARRNALEHALQEIRDPEGSRRLVLAASRIEVAAVLEKVDGLTSIAAKKRHLKKSIDDISADNIPDNLQAEELRLLEERLRSLG